ncbi:hypothetical protein Q5M85_02485 [Paraclostridium bifermentans]|nr:hypothetical protein [Paraclostridium bifermentans]
MILTEVMNKLGYEVSYNSPSDVFDEIARLTPQYGGMSYDRLEEKALQWPCPTKDHRRN